jgi:hypothetical protein
VCARTSTTLDSNVDGFEEEGYFDNFEEVQGQANQGKPSNLVAYVILVLLKLHVLSMFMKMQVLYVAITS